MSTNSEEQRRIAQTKQALRRLATGEMLKRGELFDKKDGKYEGWINRVLNRMIELGIIEAHGGSFARQYQIPKNSDRRDLLRQATDDTLVSMLIWPQPGGPFETPKPPDSTFIARLKLKRHKAAAEPDEEPEPEPD